MAQRNKYKVTETTCPECRGYGIVADYGSFMADFYGPKECPECKGKTTVKVRVRVE